eukprot:Cvel_24535.t1-p1 / transcript=Cvel_24535.t1 / gene=Cvel_24535 / organism=Chromera_velia_CCMP2878 / gene_product=Probable enoyl-CoA hydratase, putative / transcript_product=Probable enoyl-CoA hydratase, putative / location=Cvel_scaffold2663:21894-24274(+) / protein_length=130 / sequence_SO=supercontig / SO=protein_coding / is_pseudo=false
MSEVKLSWEDKDDSRLFRLQFQTPEARVTHQLIGEFHAALDTVEAHEGPCALILCNDGKFFSNGLSFEALIDDPEKLLNSFHTLLGRLLGFPIPTVAAINGHAFAGGAMMALACDFRVMNKEKGFICVNE